MTENPTPRMWEIWTEAGKCKVIGPETGGNTEKVIEADAVADLLERIVEWPPTPINLQEARQAFADAEALLKALGRER